MNGFPTTSPRSRNGKEAGQAVASVPFKSVSDESDDHILCSFCLEWFELGTTHQDWNWVSTKGPKSTTKITPSLAFLYHENGWRYWFIFDFYVKNIELDLCIRHGSSWSKSYLQSKLIILRSIPLPTNSRSCVLIFWSWKHSTLVWTLTLKVRQHDKANIWGRDSHAK